MTPEHEWHKSMVPAPRWWVEQQLRSSPDGYDVQMKAWTSGKHAPRVVAPITEAQAREAFQKWWAANDGTYVDAYLAGLRDAGLLIEDKQS